MQSMSFVMEVETWGMSDHAGRPVLILDGFLVNNYGPIPLEVMVYENIQETMNALDEFHSLACEWYSEIPNPLVKISTAELAPSQSIRLVATSGKVLSKIEDH